MRTRHRRLRTAMFVAVGLTVTALAVVAQAFGVLDELERRSVDARFSVRGRVEPPAELIVVRIDDVTFAELDVQWPFPRSLHARVIDEIAADRPKAIAYDVQFTEPTTAREDNALIEAVDRADGVVLATTEVDAGRTRIFGGDDVLAEIGARPANALLPADEGGVVRRVDHSVDGLKTFAVVTTEVATGSTVDAAGFGGGGAWIDYAGPTGTIPAVSFSHVLRGVPPGMFRGKIVVVGPTAPTLQDIHATPVDPLMAGAEVQANAVSTVLRGLPLEGSPTALDVALVVALSLLPPALAFGLRPLVSIPASLLAGGAAVVATQLAFEQGLILPFVYPLGALVLSTIGTLAIYYVVEAFERARVRDVFSRFVPEQVVDQVLATTDADLRLGGRQLEATVMFCDLRGFTTTAESMPADRVIAMLNDFLSEMSDAVLSHGGTLVSYLGDGLMAVFGAPLEQPDHADHAFAAAREMLRERLPRFNAGLLRRGVEEPFRMGIGLNSGPLMSGNVGHARRLEYTAIGDTVNTASRIEGMTKGTPYALLVAGSTHELLSPETAGELTFFEEATVRGRQQTLTLWGLAASDGGSARGDG